jgi:large subunit ribosomal protein L29
MSTLKASVVREMTTKEIADTLYEEQQSYSKMKVSHIISPLENPMLIRQKRKLIARLQTELRRRELEGASTDRA